MVLFLHEEFQFHNYPRKTGSAMTEQTLSRALATHRYVLDQIGVFLFFSSSFFQGFSLITDIPFTITNGQTYALCTLAFETDLRKIEYVEVSTIIESFISISWPGIVLTVLQRHARLFLVRLHRPQLELLLRYRSQCSLSSGQRSLACS